MVLRDDASACARVFGGTSGMNVPCCATLVFRWHEKCLIFAHPHAMSPPIIREEFPRTFGLPHFCIALAVLLGFVGLRNAAAEMGAGEQKLAALLTGDRAQRRDRSRMHADPILTAVARARAEDMAARRYMAHVNPDGIGPNALVRAAGYPLPAFWGTGRSGNFVESIGAGYATAEQAWEGWMRSPAHRTHLLASSSFYRDQTNFGVASYSDPSSPFRHYWVIITAPPSARGEGMQSSRRAAKPVRVVAAMPIWSNVDPDEGEVSEWSRVISPRPSVTCEPAVGRATVAPKLWTWPEPVSAPRPRVVRIIGAG